VQPQDCRADDRRGTEQGDTEVQPSQAEI